MPRWIQRFSPGETFYAALLITLAAVLVHGLAIPRLGFYHDDWYMLWSGASRGAGSLAPLFSMDRPFMGWIYVWYYRLLGENPAGWHIATLLWRTAGGLIFYWILRLVLPGMKHLLALAAALFVIFPGFLAEPNAATKINHLTGFTAALLSIALTLQAARSSQARVRIACSAAAVLLTAFYLWIYEYMIGLEVTRLVLLFGLHWQGRRERTWSALKTTALTYLPYLLAVGAFLFWRVFLFESTRVATDMRDLVGEYRSDFGGKTWLAIVQTIKDFFTAAHFAWSVQPYHLFFKASPAQMASALGAAALIVGLALVYWAARRQPQPLEEDDPLSPLWVLLAGALSTLGAVMPVVLSNRRIDLMDVYKGYGLHPSPGAVLIVLAVLAMFKPKFRVGVLVALLGLSAATQSLNIDYWAKFWELQRSLWWQLTWRAPDLRDETLLMAVLPDGYNLQQDYEIWGPVNRIYRNLPLSLPAIQAEVLNPETIVNVYEGSFTDPYVRDIFLPHFYQNLLLVSQPNLSSCVHVIDGSLPVYSASERFIVRQAGGYSRIDRILPQGQAPVPPPAIFGAEPPRGWCYFYQQASLARQLGDWERVAQLFDAATQAGEQPADPSEAFVFIEGLMNTGRQADAAALAARYVKDNPALRHSLCQELNDLPAGSVPPGYRQDALQALLCQ